MHTRIYFYLRETEKIYNIHTILTIPSRLEREREREHERE